MIIPSIKNWNSAIRKNEIQFLNHLLVDPDFSDSPNFFSDNFVLDEEETLHDFYTRLRELVKSGKFEHYAVVEGASVYSFAKDARLLYAHNNCTKNEILLLSRLFPEFVFSITNLHCAKTVFSKGSIDHESVSKEVFCDLEWENSNIGIDKGICANQLKLYALNMQYEEVDPSIVCPFTDVLSTRSYWNDMLEKSKEDKQKAKSLWDKKHFFSESNFSGSYDDFSWLSEEFSLDIKIDRVTFRMHYVIGGIETNVTDKYIAHIQDDIVTCPLRELVAPSTPKNFGTFQWMRIEKSK